MKKRMHVIQILTNSYQHALAGLALKKWFSTESEDYNSLKAQRDYNQPLTKMLQTFRKIGIFTK